MNRGLKTTADKFPYVMLVTMLVTMEDTGSLGATKMRKLLDNRMKKV